MVKLKREQRKKDDRTLTVLELCVITFFITFFWKTRKRAIALGDKKKYATPTNEDIGQTSNWSKLVAAYLPVARLTILDRLVEVYFDVNDYKVPAQNV